VVVVCVVPLGAGVGDPLVGISPAIAETDSAQVKVVTIRNRFTGIRLLLLRMQDFLHRQE
jgi:hypothetical protein